MLFPATFFVMIVVVPSALTIDNNTTGRQADNSNHQKGENEPGVKFLFG